MVLYDVWVVQLVENSNLLHNTVNILLQLDLIHDLDSDLEILIMLVRRLEDTSEGANTEHFG